MGGPFWARREEGAWSIVKGELDPGEEPVAAALREFREETGFEPAGELRPLTPIRQAGGKKVIAFALEAPDLDPTAVRSNSFKVEWPRGSGQWRSYAEIDRAAWLRPDEARRLIVKAQTALIDELEVCLRRLRRQLLGREGAPRLCHAASRGTPGSCASRGARPDRPASRSGPRHPRAGTAAPAARARSHRSRVPGSGSRPPGRRSRHWPSICCELNRKAPREARPSVGTPASSSQRAHHGSCGLRSGRRSRSAGLSTGPARRSRSGLQSGAKRTRSSGYPSRPGQGPGRCGCRHRPPPGRSRSCGSTR